MKMAKKTSTFIGVVLFAVFAVIGSSFAGGGFEGGAIPAGYVDPSKIDSAGPVAWAVAVVECMGGSDIKITMRAKQLVDCDVILESISWEDTWPDVDNDGNLEVCPGADVAKLKSMILYYGFPGWPWFDGVNVISNPVITKIKNIDVFDGNQAYSFDAQIRNFLP